MKKIALILIFHLFLLVPTKSYAWNAPCMTALSSLGSAAAGAAQLPIAGALGTGVISATPFMTAFVPYLNELIDCASFNVFQGEMMISTVLTSSFTQLEDDMIQDDAMVANEITNAIVTKEMGGATPSAPSVAVGGAGCQSVDAAAQVSTGAMGRTLAETSMAGSIQNVRRVVTTGTQPVAYINTQTPPSFDDQSLFVTGGGAIEAGSSSTSSSSSGPTQNDTSHYIMNLTEPIPPSRPSTLNQTTPAARQMVANLKIYDARMNLAQGAIERIASWNTATYPLASWLQKSMTTMGAPMPTVNSSGLISEHQMMSALVNARFANPAWYSNVAVENSSDLLREVAYENAISLKMEAENHDIFMRLLAIEASDYAISLRKGQQ